MTILLTIYYMQKGKDCKRGTVGGAKKGRPEALAQLFGRQDMSQRDSKMNIYAEQFIDLRVYQSGMEKCVPGYSFGPARRQHYLFHYVTSGSGTLTWADAEDNRHEERISATEGFLMYPGQICTYTADMTRPWSYMWIEFDGLRVQDSLRGTDLSRNNPIYRSKYADLREQMVKEMYQICSDNDGEQIFHIIAHLYLFLAYFTESARTTRIVQGNKIRDHYVRTALDYIENNYSSPIRIDDIAAQCGIDRSYFGKIFHDVMGQSPRRFLLQYRMRRAGTLLENTDMSVAAVGAAVGYDNPLHFSRAFKNVHGVSPREWRAKHRKPSST